MKMKTKVYIQYPWRVSDSQYYKSMIDNAPKNIEYIFENKPTGIITNRTKLILFNSLKRSIRNPLEKTELPILNIKKTVTDKEYDIIHNAHCLSKNNSPWVADFESLWQMWVSGRDTSLGKRRVLEVLKKDSCKRIIAWTEYTKERIGNKFPEIKDKIVVVPYGMEKPEFKKIESKKIRLLFIARYFYEKGGMHTIEVMDRITKLCDNVEARIISEVPKKVIKEYSKNKKIKISGLLPHKEIMKDIYPNSDIMIYPGYSDTFGFALVESLAFGIPVITVDGHSRKDIIENNKTGFIIERSDESNWYPKGEEVKRIIEELERKTMKLIKNKKLRNKMSEQAIKTVENGKFSIKKRNKILSGVYNEARNI